MNSEICKVRIKRGTVIWQDFRAMRWPKCLVGVSGNEVEDPDMVFEAAWDGRSWNCKADGFGFMYGRGAYGNGSIYISDHDGVEILDPDTSQTKKPIPAVLYGPV